MSASRCGLYWQLSALQLHCQLNVLMCISFYLGVCVFFKRQFCFFLWVCWAVNLPSVSTLEPMKPWTSFTGWETSEVSCQAGHFGVDGPEQRRDGADGGRRRQRWASGQGSAAGEGAWKRCSGFTPTHCCILRHSTVNILTDFSTGTSPGRPVELREVSNISERTFWGQVSQGGWPLTVEELRI